eukprot:655456-Amphidinium_carterae.1
MTQKTGTVALSACPKLVPGEDQRELEWPPQRQCQAYNQHRGAQISDDRDARTALLKLSVCTFNSQVESGWPTDIKTQAVFHRGEAEKHGA